MKKEQKKAITQRIIELRKERGFSSYDMAEELKMSDTNYRKYESEDTPWSKEYVELIAKIFDVSPVYLLYGRERGVPYIEEGEFYFKDDTACIDGETEKMLEIWSSASDEDRVKILKIIEISLKLANGKI